ncbi:MAK10-like protein [Tanacetum coccineum]
MGDENPICTLGDYNRPSHEGYQNTIELLDGNNVVPLRSDTIRLVQNGCSFHELRFEDPNQHLKDLLKLVDSLDLDVANRERTRLRESLPEAWTRFKDLLQKVPHHGIDLWLKVQIFYDHVNLAIRRTIDQSAGRKLCGKNTEESWALLEDLTLMTTNVEMTQGTSLNWSRESHCPKMSRTINDRMTGALPSDTDKNPKLNVNSTPSVLSARSYPMEDPQSSSHPLNLITAIKILAHAPMYNAILDKYVESLELGKNGSAFIQGEMPKKMKDPGLFTLACRLGDSKPFDTLADLGSCVYLIPLYFFKKLKIRLVEETDHVFRLADGTKSYPVGIVKNVEVHIGRLKLLEDFYVIDMEKDLATPLLVGKGFLATVSAVIDCRKAKIAIG